MNTFLRALPLIATACLALPVAAHASEARDCAPEPSDTTIGYGEVFNGANCVITPGTDVDVLRFAGSIGEVVRVAVSNLAGPGTIIAQVRDPDGVLLISLTNPTIGEGNTRWAYETLAKNGTFSISVFEAGSDSTASYGVALERVSPAGPDAVPLTLGVEANGQIDPENDIDMFRFEAAAGSLIRISVDPELGFPVSTMLQAVNPAGDPYHPLEVSSTGPFFSDITIDQTGTQTIQIRTYQTTHGTYGYAVRIDCISGPCTPPDCTLEVDPGYANGTLNLGFALGNRLGAATWNLWLSVANQTISVLTVPIPNVDPPVNFNIPLPGVPDLNNIAVFSTITTGSAGIVCIDTETVQTSP